MKYNFFILIVLFSIASCGLKKSLKLPKEDNKITQT